MTSTSTTTLARSWQAHWLPPGTFIGAAPGVSTLYRATGDPIRPWAVDHNPATVVTHAHVDRVLATGGTVLLPGAPTVTHPLRDTLAAALRWLYLTEQPPEALVNQHGYARPIGDRAVCVTPTRIPVIIFGTLGESRDSAAVPTDEELTTNVAAIVRAGAALELPVTVEDSWAGPGTSSHRLGCVPHPDLLAAFERYLEGCPTHGGVFCHRHTPPCPWVINGRAAATEPTWPALPPPRATGEDTRTP